MSASLDGKAILVVDDESLIAFNLEQLIRDAGGVAHVAATCASALKIIEATHLDAVLLDVHLEDESSYVVAAELRRRGIPFVFLTGYLTIREGYEKTPFLAKPISGEAVSKTIQGLIEDTAGRSARAPS